MNSQYIQSVSFFMVLLIIGCNGSSSPDILLSAPEPTIIRYDRPDASILKGVEVPANKKLFFSSGLVTLPNDTTAPERTLERYGDTYTQSLGCLTRLKNTLGEAGLELKDVIYLGVFIAPDARNDNKIDFDAWFEAYGKKFNNPQNPVKTARTTLGVASLARPYLLVEVEAIAVYP
ncbi:MAG: RidA family protein [Bacteroidetes bacterium]|nr:RidA family protein [Bacteroidota bacterium]